MIWRIRRKMTIELSIYTYDTLNYEGTLSCDIWRVKVAPISNITGQTIYKVQWY